MNWRERLAQEPRLRDISTWPVISLGALSAARRKAFLRNQQVVAQVLAGDAYADIARRHQISTGRISQLLARALGGNERTPPALTEALVPFRTTQPKKRSAPIPTLAKGAGFSGAFTALLDQVPGLREGLDDMIKAKLKDADYAQRLRPATFHGEYKRLLAEAHWPHDRYPYTTDSCAYESVRRYLHQRHTELQRERQRRRQRPPRDFGSHTRQYRALRRIQIDEHTLDVRTRIHLLLNDELIPLSVGRASVLTAIDVGDEAVLGYLLAPTGHPSQQDLLILLDNCVRPWRPLELVTPGLSYASGACFPSGLDGGFPISFGIVQMDNALMHLARSVGDLLCEQNGATLSLGPPRMPKIRQKVEGIFDYINEHCSHRFPSTTGTGPQDPERESRRYRNAPPAVTFETINEALSVVLTEHNVTSLPALGGANPLALHRHHCANHYVRYVPDALARQWQPLMGAAELPLLWYTHENRMPHVNFQYCRYKGPGLLDAAGKEKHIRVTFNYLDLRTLRAYTLAGEDLGELLVDKSWQRFPHSLTTRRWIHKNARRLHFNARDPLSAYFRYLLENKGKPSAALSLIKVYNEFTGGLATPLYLGDDRPVPLIKGAYTWTTDMANHRS